MDSTIVCDKNRDLRVADDWFSNMGSFVHFPPYMDETMNDNISEWESVASSISVQSYSGSVYPASKEKKHKTGGGSMNTGTLYAVECPECGETGDVVAWHGSNCFYACPTCDDTVIEVSG